MPDPIRSALHAAALATMTASEREHADTCHNGQPGPGHVKRAAETVAAFLRALPIECEDRSCVGFSYRGEHSHDAGHWHARYLATAVEKAARDE